MMYPVILMSSVCFTVVKCFPDQGQWSRSYHQKNNIIFGMHKTLYAGSTVSLSVNCYSAKSSNINISWVLRQTSCFEEYLGPDILNDETLRIYFECPITRTTFSKIRYAQSNKPITTECSPSIHLEYNGTSFQSFVEDNIDSLKNVPPGCNAEISKDVEQGSAKDAGSSIVAAGDTSVKGTENHHVAADEKPRKRRAVPETKNSSGKESQPPASSSNSVAQPPSTKELKKSKENSKENPKESDSSVHKDKSGGEVTTSAQREIPPPAPKNLGGAITGSKIAVVDMDGVYLFIVNIQSLTRDPFNVTVEVSMKGDYGYLSAVDWPLLPFYGFMCGVYVIYAFAWLFVSALQWRDLLRIQFWIGGVILLGLMEKAVFYAEYQSINSTGQSVQGAVLFAEILSCMKRTLARMLVIIVSLGFGIVKPRLGPMLHRVVGVGGLYFVLGTIEGCLRVLKPKNDPSNQALMAGIPLAVTDSAICWWIFSSLVQTIRTLRLRRNVVKLSLYRHFTNTLIFAVVASVAYMIWSIHSHKLVSCITDWKELWVDEAYWHLLFSVVLLVIMILWRPTNNNQRYAFTPLLDAADDEEDDDMDANPPNDAFAGMKMRTSKNQTNMSPKQNDAKNKQEDDLKWVEENIPSSLTDTALPSLLDSDEEIMTAKFERSKME